MSHLFPSILGWIDEVRKRGGGGVKIVPRVLFEGWSLAQYQQLFADDEIEMKLAEFLAQQLMVSLPPL